MMKLWRQFSIYPFLGLIASTGWWLPQLAAGDSRVLDWYPLLIVVVLVLLLLVVKWTSLLSFRQSSYWWQVITPALFLTSVFLFFLFINGFIWKELFFLVAALFMWVYLYNLYLYYQRPERYHAFTLENYAWYVHLLSSFLYLSALYGFIIFLNIGWFIFVPLLVLFFTLIFFQLWWVKKLGRPHLWIILFTYLTVLLQVFVVLRLLPFNFYLLSFWGTAMWYLTLRLLFDVEKSVFVSRKFSLLSGFIFVLAILLTITTKIF